MANRPNWLDIVRHRLTGFRAPYLLIVQHHDVPSATLLAAPVTLPLPRDADVLAPPLSIGGTAHRARLLDMTAVPRAVIGETVASAQPDAAAIADAIDVILFGYPVGRPF
jgi:hypothetical protein